MPSVFCIRIHFKAGINKSNAFLKYFVLLFFLASFIYSAPGISKENNPKLILASQPLAIPTGIVLEAVVHDKQLNTFLNSKNINLQVKSFKKGRDIINAIENGEVNGGVAGDGPVIIAGSLGKINVLGQVKLNYAAVIGGKELLTLSDLKGKRLCYAPASSAHFIAMIGLKSVALSEDDVQWVRCPLDQMSVRLENDQVDAFAAWEPVPTLSIQENKNLKILYRSITSSWFFLESQSQLNEEFNRELKAAVNRALIKLKKRKFLRQAILWTYNRAKLAGFNSEFLKHPKIPLIAHNGLKVIKNTKTIPKSVIEPGGRIYSYYEFLNHLKKLKEGSSLENLNDAFKPLLK